ncbi:hypothetical protein [Streptosporangium roseum]|uniref:hypothetical protein n=1 Tax=Streptosporangium roseum TaxID=2001 RepID=UPI003327FE99
MPPEVPASIVPLFRAGLRHDGPPPRRTPSTGWIRAWSPRLSLSSSGKGGPLRGRDAPGR